MKNTFLKKIISFQVILLIASFGFVQNVLAGYGDTEISQNNNIVASSLDAEIVIVDNEWQLSEVAKNMLSGDSVSRRSEIKNVGKSDFLYNIKFVKLDGDDNLCNGLQLDAKKEGVSVYGGYLSAFDIDMDVLSSGEDDDWEFVITMPDNLSSDENCDFDFEYIAWQTVFSSPDQGGWVDKEVLSDNKIHSGIENPIQTGYNENNGDGYDTPHFPDANELTCTGDVTNINGISVHWIDVSNGNDNVKYQRQYKVGAGSWHGNEIYTNPYTNYRSFGGGSGNEGIYGSRVRAWADVDDDNVVDSDETVSDWSNECFVEFDKTAPAMPTGLQRLSATDHNVVYECGDVVTIQSMHPDWDDNAEDDFDHYEYTSFNAPNGTIGLNEKVFYDSIFEYNGSWLPHDGTYGFAVRAVDKAGNKSDWALSGKTLDGSCQITYDSTGPEVTVDAIKYLDGTIEPDKFVTNYNTPTIVGNVSDVYSDVVLLELEVDGHTYTGSIVGGEWSVDITDILPDGTHTLNVTAKDSLGNESVATKEITIDTVAPTAQHTFYKDGIEIEDFEVRIENGKKFSYPVVYVNSPTQLSFTGEYIDEDTTEHPSSGLYWDSYAIFEAQDDGSFRFSQNGKKAFCSWRRNPNLVDISDEATFSLTTKKSFADCVETLPDGEYYIAHHIYDYATRKDIPSINQFRDVLGMRFVVDTVPEMPASIRILDHEDTDLGCDGVTNNRNITVDWGDNTEDDFDHYDYQIREGLTIAQPTVSERSGKIRDEDGYYKYRVRAVDNHGNESDWTDWCGVTLDRDIHQVPLNPNPNNELGNRANDEDGEKDDDDDDEKDIVLNEFMPKPAYGTELVELYNVGTEKIDVDGWYITDEKGPNKHKRKIDAKHTDTGSTTIAPGKYLVIQNYDSFYLNDGGDTIKLFDDDNLIDSYKYKSSEVSTGKTIARDWDDEGKWVDPIPTFGAKNDTTNDKEKMKEYYQDRCFVDDKSVCDEGFMYDLGLLVKENDEIMLKNDDEDVKKDDESKAQKPKKEEQKNDDVEEKTDDGDEVKQDEKSTSDKATMDKEKAEEHTDKSEKTDDVKEELADKEKTQEKDEKKEKDAIEVDEKDKVVKEDDEIVKNKDSEEDNEKKEDEEDAQDTNDTKDVENVKLIDSATT